MKDLREGLEEERRAMVIRAEAMQDLAQNTREAIRVGFAEYK